LKIHFSTKDAGRAALAGAITEILAQEAIYSGVPTLVYTAGGYIIRCSARQKTNLKGAKHVNIRFSVTSGGRKAFAKAVAEILGMEAVYNGTPTFTYTIGSYTVDREGGLICPADTDPDEADRLIAALSERGYEADKTPDYATLQMTEREELGLGHERRDHQGEDGMLASDVPEAEDNRLTVEIPKEFFSDMAIENLKKIIGSKETLIKKALGADDVSVVVTEDKLLFPWFTLTDTEGEMDAYAHFVFTLCEMAKQQKQITAKERDVENEKFTMRLFLIRLGFIGPEHKVARKILLRNLTGNPSWKNGQKPKNTEGGNADGE